MNPLQYLLFVEAERGTSFFYELGEDCSGPNVVKCNCEACKERLIDESENLISDIRTRQAARA